MVQNGAREGPRGGPGRAWGYRKTGFEATWPPSKKSLIPSTPFDPKSRQKGSPGSSPGTRFGSIFGVFFVVLLNVLCCRSYKILDAFWLHFGSVLATKIYPGEPWAQKGRPSILNNPQMRIAVFAVGGCPGGSENRSLERFEMQYDFQRFLSRKRHQN